mgnify:CR=1 FL=1
MNCIFCKIVAGELPCYRVYEDERVLAFLDIQPLARGHTLVIPKQHFARLEEMPEDLAGACASVATMLSRRVIAATGCTGWNLLQNNGRVAHQAVDHVHFHIIPRWAGDTFDFTWPAGKLDKDDAAELVKAIGSN